MCFLPARARAGSYLWVTHSAHILTSYVIYYWTDARQHGMYLFNVITKQTTTDKAKASLCPLWRTRKKPFDIIYYLYKLKQYHWFLCVVAWIMIGPGKSRHWWKTCKTNLKNAHYSHIFLHDFYIHTPSSASVLREMVLFFAETNAYVFCMLFEFLPSFKRTIHQFDVYFLSFKFVQTAGITGKVHATSSFPRQRTGIQQKKRVKHSVPSLS